MLKEVLKILKNRPSNAPDLMYPDYEAALRKTELLTEILKREWNEETYKQLAFFKELLSKQPSEPGYDPDCLFIYTQFFYYMLDWFYYKTMYLPFEAWDQIGKESFDLLKILFKENQLEEYKKNERFLKIHKQCESKLKVILQDKKVLTILLNFREGKKQYEELYRLSYLVQRNAEYIEYHPGAEFFKRKDVLSIYIDVQRYMYDWRKFYGAAIMFEDWEDLREEGIGLLKQFIHENKLSEFKEDDRYKQFFKKIPSRYSELLKRDYHQVNKFLKTSNKALKPGKDLKKFIDILDQEEEVNLSFFEQYGKDILKNAKLLSALINEDWDHLKKKHLKLVRLARTIFCAVRAMYSGRKRRFSGILPIYECFQEYMDAGCGYFGNRRIPFKDWKDLSKLEDDLLKALIEDNKLHQFKEDPRYIYFYRKILQHKEYLMKNGYYNKLYVRDSNG